MSLKLEPLNASVLTNMEFGQLMNRHNEDLATIAPAMLTDAPYNNYVRQITTKSATYQKGLAQVQKNEETDKIALLDGVRDKSVNAFSRALKLYDLSDEPKEVEASKALGILLRTFKDLAILNYEAESIGIDKLVSELESDKYASHVALLNIGRYVTRMKVSNENFKTLFGNRMVTGAMTESYDLKVIRKEMLKLYSDFTLYVLAMAKTEDAPPLFITALTLLNTARKYYADLLARRVAVKEVKEKQSV
ncbi:MAG TPA: DUF6261 family protein [Prolixibacteraceae bacterium]|nr:DUF6261 family protein [Prolixibacteraceae bacterium]